MFVANNSDATSWHELLHHYDRFAPSFVTQLNAFQCTKIVQNAPNMSLGSNGVDRVHSLRKFLKRLLGTNFCTSSARFAPSFLSHLNGPKCTKIVLNVPKHVFRDQWDGSGAFVSKNFDATSWYEMHQNCTKCTKT